MAVAGVGRGGSKQMAVDFHCYDPQGGVTVENHTLELVDTRSELFWPSSLEGLVMQLLMVAGPRGVSTWLGPGADVDVNMSALHYRCLMKSGLLEKAQQTVPGDEMFKLQDGAIVAPFQAAIQCLALSRVFAVARRVCMLSDRITLHVTEVLGRAPSMARSNGIDCPGAEELFGRLGLGKFWEKLIKPIYFTPDDLLASVGGGLFKPAEHDSPPGREALYCAPSFWGEGETDYAIGTGGWNMASVRLRGPRVLNDELFRIGAAQEGIGGAASWICNSICSGPLFTDLKVETGWSYPQIAAEAMQHLPWSGRELQLLNKEPVDTALELLQEFGAARAFALVIHSTAKRTVEDLFALSQVTGMNPPEVVAVGGGWSENPAFLWCLESFGIRPFVPRFAEHLTADAGAADLLRCVLGVTFKEALQMAWRCREGLPMIA